MKLKKVLALALSASLFVSSTTRYSSVMKLLLKAKAITTPPKSITKAAAPMNIAALLPLFVNLYFFTLFLLFIFNSLNIILP